MRPGIGHARRAELAQSIIAAITGHHLICDLTDAGEQLWDRLTVMWSNLLPMIATERWLREWHPSDWAHRPRPSLVPPSLVPPSLVTPSQPPH